MEYIIYVIQYKINEQAVIVYDWTNKRDAIFTSLFEAKKARHDLYHFYKGHFKAFKKTKFADYKIVKYKEVTE